MRRFPRDLLQQVQNASPPGLLSRQGRGRGPAVTVRNLFADLRTIEQGEIIAEHPQRNLQGIRVSLQRTEGHGTWELYRLDHELYMVIEEGIYDGARTEMLPGEGLLAIHLYLSGQCSFTLPHSVSPGALVGPTLAVVYQPPGVSCIATVRPGVRDTRVSLYCRPEYVAQRARTSGETHWPLLDEIARHPSNAIWHRQFELSPTLTYIARSLLDSPHRQGIRLLHAEAKALEILCEIHAATAVAGETTRLIAPDSQCRQLDAVRRAIARNLSSPMSISTVAKSFGLSESKLKRAFKARFGVTVFDYSLECRMQHALELLRCRRMPVGQVAHVVGYSHQTSFAAAFERFFGFLPSRARNALN